jgi:hypothetical protein
MSKDEVLARDPLALGDRGRIEVASRRLSDLALEVDDKGGVIVRKSRDFRQVPLG